MFNGGIRMREVCHNMEDDACSSDVEKRVDLQG